MKPFTISLPWQNWWYTPTDEARQEVFNNLAADGVRHLVLTNTLLKEYLGNIALLKIHAKQMANAGLTFVDAHAPYGLWHDLSTPVPEYHALMIERQKMALRLCHICGVHTMTFHAGNIDKITYGSQLTLNDYYSNLMHSLEELLPVARENNVIMALENIWVPMSQSTLLLKVIRHFNTPWLGFCYDSGHANLTQRGRAFPEKSVVPRYWEYMGLPTGWEEDIITQFKPYVVNCHLHDNNGMSDQHLIPGAGTVDWEHVMQVLLAAPNLQCIQSEVGITANGPSIPQLLAAFKKLHAC